VSVPARAGVPLSIKAGELMVDARPSEVAPDQLAALRRHKAALLPLLAAFGTAEVAIRPATPTPVEPALGDWVWSEPLRRRRREWR
jgi:hypothetical protein